MADQRPMLLLDVEGVLFPSGPTTPPGFTDVDNGRYHVRWSRKHSIWLRELIAHCDLVWATTWEEWANEVFSPLLRIPPLPVIEFVGHLGPGPPPATRKLPDVEAFVGERPVAWIDDNLYDDAFAWAEHRSAPTLLVRTESSIGMTAEHRDELRAFVGLED